MSRRRNDPPPPAADAPSMSMADIAKTAAANRNRQSDQAKASMIIRPSQILVDKTAYSIPTIDVTRVPQVSNSTANPKIDKTAFKIPKIDETKNEKTKKENTKYEKCEPEKRKYNKSNSDKTSYQSSSNKPEKLRYDHTKSEKTSKKYDKTINKKSPYPKIPSATTFVDDEGITGYTVSAVPPNISRVPLTQDYNDKMRRRQTRYETLPRNEQEEQEAWAQARLQQVGNCPRGFLWFRWKDGYRCHGGDHRVTDQLLAESKGDSCKLLLRRFRIGTGPRIWPDETWSEPMDKEELGVAIQFVAPVVDTQLFMGGNVSALANMNFQAILRRAGYDQLMNPNSVAGHRQPGAIHINNPGNAFDWRTFQLPPLDSSQQPSGSNIYTSGPSSSSSKKKPRDKEEEMKNRQNRYAFLPPKEQAEQDEWVFEKLTRNKALAKCAKGFEFVRVEGRYQCYRGKGAHVVTDDLIVEGLGGYWVQHDWDNLRGKWPHGFEGPLYPEEHGSRTITATKSKNGEHKERALAASSSSKLESRKLGDSEMRKRQSRYTTMSPEEQKEQNCWALNWPKTSGICEMGFIWERVDDGYICEIGSHRVKS